MGNYLNTFDIPRSHDLLVRAASSILRKLVLPGREDLPSDNPEEAYRQRAYALLDTISAIDDSAEVQWRTQALDPSLPPESNPVHIRDRHILKHRDDRRLPEQKLLELIGVFILQSDMVLLSRFGMSVENIFAQNIFKLEDRIARGVVFKNPDITDSGDDR